MAKIGRPKIEITPEQDVKVFNSVEELFKYRLQKNKPNKHIGKQSIEKAFCDELESVLHKILNKVKYRVVSIAREFSLIYGRCDFLVELENGEYLVIECKAKNQNTTDNTEELRFCYAIGQLQTYRTILNFQYQIPKEKVHLMLATNYDSLLVHSVIGAEKLDVDYLVYNDMGAKYYGARK